MAHRRRPLAVALGLNSAVLAAEIAGGFGANSLSLIVDGIHNFSDEVAIAFLVLAYTLRKGLSGHLLRSANLLNSVGLLAISGLLLWEAVTRLIHPPVVLGVVPVIAGIIGALGNWGVARVLREPSREDPAIRLAYVHNLVDVLVSLAPVGSGVLTIVFGSFFFDPLAALLIGAVIVTTTLRAVIGSHEELLWPQNVSCGHPRNEQSA
ncbi:MAG: cation transporter [Candidatus Binatia bacterium]